MIDVKQAVKAAMAYAQDLFGVEQALTLEEVDMSDDDGYWLITLGIGGRLTPIEVLGGVRTQRDYKVFTVEAKSGKVISMKIRSVSPE